MQQVDLMAGNYLEFFALTRDPFEPTEAFFPGAGRQLLLGQLLHLSQFSSAVLVVSGSLGSGRTCFAKKYAMEAEAWSDNVCFIDVAKLHQPEELFTHLADAYGLQVEAGVKSGELLVDIRQAVTQRQLVLVCDGAELLDDRVLSALLSLLQDPSDQSPLRVLLTGDELLVARLDAFGMLDVLVQDWQLDDFSRADIAQYLSFLLVSAGSTQKDVFSADELERLWQLSDGLPGRVQLPARELLIDKALQASVVNGRPERGVPAWAIAAAACCAAFFVVAFLYRADLSVPIEHDSGGFGPESIAAVHSADVPPPQMASSGVLAEVEGGAEQDALEGQAGVLAEAGTITELGAHSVAGEPLNTPLQVESEFEDDRQLALKLPSAKMSFQKPVIELPVSVESPASVAAPISVRPESGFELAEQHLMSLDKRHFVLQVLGAASRVSVEAFVAAQENNSELYVFVTARSGKPWYTVVMGDYPSRSEAKVAIESLPSGQQVAGVWPRSVADVHSKMSEN